MSITCEKVIENFIAGVKEGDIGSVSSTNTVRIRGNQLIHYETPIIERDEDGFIFNITRHSLATGQLQKRIKEKLPEGYRIARKVQRGYNGSLKDFMG